LKVGTLKDWHVSDIYTHSYCRQLTACWCSEFLLPIYYTLHPVK